MKNPQAFILHIGHGTLGMQVADLDILQLGVFPVLGHGLDEEDGCGDCPLNDDTLA